MVRRSQQFPPVSYWWPLLPNSIFFSVCPMAAYLVGIQTIVDSDALNRYIKAALPSMSDGYQTAMRERVGALDGFALIADGLPT